MHEALGLLSRTTETSHGGGYSWEGGVDRGGVNRRPSLAIVQMGSWAHLCVVQIVPSLFLPSLSLPQRSLVCSHANSSLPAPTPADPTNPKLTPLSGWGDSGTPQTVTSYVSRVPVNRTPHCSLHYPFRCQAPEILILGPPLEAQEGTYPGQTVC